MDLFLWQQEIDYIMIVQPWKASLMSCRTYLRADCYTDQLMVATQRHRGDTTLLLNLVLKELKGSRSLHARLQVVVCSGYDLCHSG